MIPHNLAIRKWGFPMVVVIMFGQMETLAVLVEMIS
jgi:hypothetical protein